MSGLQIMKNFSHRHKLHLLDILLYDFARLRILHLIEYSIPLWCRSQMCLRSRKRNITWYNPPFSQNVATNIGMTFLKILDNEFPVGHILHKIFNRNTVKISYCCMSNIKQNIDGHNKSILTPKPVKEAQVNICNCRKPIECPIPKNCQTESIVYQATVSTSDKRPPETYVGLTENKFKLRYANHKTSFRSILKHGQKFKTLRPCYCEDSVISQKC